MRVLLALVAAAAVAQTPEIRFVDVAAKAGLTASNTFGGKERKDYLLETTGTGAAIFDSDGDGANDIFLANGTVFGKAGATPSQLYRNDGHGRFQEVGRDAGFTRTGWAQGVCAGDYDNDGRPDLLVTYYGSNALYRNLGGKFADVTAKSGLPVSGTRWGSGCAFVDYDRDGLLDLFVANYVDLDLSKTPKPGENGNCEWKGLMVACGPRGLPTGKNALYRNNGDGTFTDVSEKAGILAPGGRYGLGVVAADFDNDGWPDIYVACDQTASLLYRNKHDGTFEERGSAAGVAYNFDGRLQAGMGVAVGDYDGNGFLDIAKTNFSGDRPSLYRNDDGSFFEDVSERVGLGKNLLLGWGITWLDVDEDGWPDLVITNGHLYPEIDKSAVGETYREKTLLYRNLGNGRFADVTGAAGPGFATPRPGRGLAIGDVDGDGRPEILIANMNDQPSLLKNVGPRGSWLAVELKATKSNRSAIGARVTVEAGGRKQIQEVVGGGSYYSQSAFALYFGLGKAARVERITVRWPSGESQTFEGGAPNRTVRLTER
jgi:hypothetical protein